MSRFTGAPIFVACAILGTTACGSATVPTSQTPVQYPQTTENYAGSIKIGETKSFHFTVQNPGSLDVVITSLNPVSTLTMGLFLGTWDDPNQSCVKSSVFSELAKVNLVLSGTPQAAGEYCVGIYDVGNLQDSSDFELLVRHY
jgi:hypothetical protein